MGLGAPSGTVTFLFTDIEGSTRLWQDAPDAMRRALERHDSILRAAIDEHAGYVFSTGGDGFAAAFARAGEAVSAAVETQASLAAHPWNDASPIRVRMGIHTGAAEERDGDYFGPPVNQTARLMAIGHGGQVLCSAVTAGLVGPAVKLVDLGEHRLRDLSAAERIFQVGDGLFPPLRSLDAVPGNLPTVLTELVGRTDDVARLASLLERERLVTLIGAGGIGKTRLALAVAAATAPRFPDGCWFVELAPVATRDEVVGAMSAAIGTSVAGTADLARYVADRQLLVVLDNCEHVLPDAAQLAQALVAAGPEVVVVATSREPLGVDSETVRAVASLETPDADDVPLVDAAGTSAVRLFVARAQAASDQFRLDETNVGAVVAICKQLDGIPLAIELAAARVRAMRPAEIARRLAERIWSLTIGKGALERHRTLQAAIDWSYDLLTDQDRGVFRRLAVFPASFDLEAGESVAADPEVPDVIDGLVRLVDRSLVQFDATSGRYRMLETLRQYGAERLRDAGETDRTRLSHARYFLDLAERIGPETEDARYDVAQAVLTSELENLRAAAEWCMDGGRWTDLAEMALRIRRYLYGTAPADGVTWYSQIVERSLDVEPSALVDVLGELAWITDTHVGDKTRALPLAERSVSLARDRGTPETPWASMALASARLYAGQFAEMLRLSEQALVVAEGRDDHIAASVALGYISLAHIWLGDAERSELMIGEALRRSERNGHRDAIQAAIINASTRYIWRDPPNFSASLTALERFDHVSRVEDAMGGWVDLMWGATLVGLNRPGAVARLARTVRLSDRLGALQLQDIGLRILALAVARAGFADEAARLVGYGDARIHVFRRESPPLAWHVAALDEVLAGLTTRVAEESAGAASTRSQILALVKHLDEVIDHQ